MFMLKIKNILLTVGNQRKWIFMNIFEVLKDSLAPFMDDEKGPLHIGEAFNLWTTLAGLEEALRITIVQFNVADDPELKVKLQELAELKKSMIDDARELMSAENVSFPKQSLLNPVLDSFQAPTGGKPTDEQIANQLVFHLTVGIQWYARFASESLRADVGLYFTKNVVRYISFGTTFKPLMIKNGWLKVPPPFNPYNRKD